MSGSAGQGGLEKAAAAGRRRGAVGARERGGERAHHGCLVRRFAVIGQAGGGPDTARKAPRPARGWLQAGPGMAAGAGAGAGPAGRRRLAPPAEAAGGSRVGGRVRKPLGPG